MENFRVKFPQKVFLNSKDRVFQVAALLMVQCYTLNQHKTITSPRTSFSQIKILVVSLLVYPMYTHLDAFWNAFASLSFNTSNMIYNTYYNVLLVSNSYRDTFFAEEPFIINFSCYYYKLINFLVHLTFLGSCYLQLIVQPGI